MSGSVNKVILIGNLGADPEVRQTAGGQDVATLSLATSESFTGRDGQRQERTEWHRVIVWGKLAELAQRYLQKGRKVFVEGRIQTRSWDDAQAGVKRYATEIVATELTFLDGGAGGRDGGQGQTREEPRRPQGGQAAGRAPGGREPAGREPQSQGFFDGDVPF